MNWKTIKFSDLFDFQKKSKIKAGDGLPEGKYPFFTSSNVLSKYSNDFCFDKPSLIFGTGGMPSVHHCEKKFNVSTDCFVVSPKNPKEVLPKYVYYFFVNNMQILIDGFKGAGLKHISKEYINEIRIPIPPFDKQKQIVMFLDKTESVLQKQKHRIAHYAELSESVFIKMFGDPLLNKKKWPLYNLRALSVKFSDGPFGSNLKTSHYTSTGVRVIRLQNIGVGVFHDGENDKSYVSNSHYENVLKKHTCVPGDVLIGTMGDPNVRACILPRNIEKAINKADCVLFRPNENLVTSEYICTLLNLPSALSMVSHMMHGQTRVRISMGQLATLNIPVPPIDLIKKYTSIKKNIESQKSKAEMALNQSEELFNSLIQRAFKGELSTIKELV
jgi:type I restriction enzyme S subunit